MSSANGQDAAASLKLYLGAFGALSIVTLIELLPVIGVMAVPPGGMLILAAIQLVCVGAVVVHVLGDKTENWRLFVVPLGMGGASAVVLGSLILTWGADYRTLGGATDPDNVAARYFGGYSGECNAWVTSNVTGTTYCSSPGLGWSNQSAYDAFAAKAPSGPDPEFASFDSKSLDEKKALLMAKGEKVYSNCAACHGAEGAGTPNVFPPLAGDSVANGGSVDEHIAIVLNGLSGKVIGGVTYAAAMSPWKQLSDEEIASVITYERNSWGNAGGIVEPAQVKAARGK